MDNKKPSAHDILSQKQKDFCIYFIETDSSYQSALRAGYSERTAAAQGSRLLTNVKIQNEIARLRKEMDKDKVATAEEVMRYFTSVMRGEIKDQFGLDASLSERTRAAQELARRTVDIDNRNNGQADAKVEIVLDWGMDNTTE